MIKRSLALTLVTVACALHTGGHALAAETQRLPGQGVDAINKRAPPLGRAAKNSPQNAQRHATALGLGPEYGLRIKDYSEDQIGSYYRYIQLYRGIPIHGQQAVVSEDKEGRIRSTFGRVTKNVHRDVPNIQPRLSGSQAKYFATQHWARSVPGSGKPIMTTSELSIAVDQASKSRLVYVVSFGTEGGKVGPQSPEVVVDANSGEVVSSADRNRH